MSDEPLHPDVVAAEAAAADPASRKDLPPAYLDFRLAVLRLSRRPLQEGETASPMPPDPGPDALEAKARAGEPLLDPDGPLPEGDGFREDLKAIATLMEEAGVEGGADLRETLERDETPDLDGWARALLSRDADALRAAGEAAGGVNPSLLRFAVSHALHRRLAPVREAFGHVLRLDVWMRGHCPVCGGDPDMGKLVREPSGARLLHCPACGMVWRGPRLACAFCGSEEHAGLRTFTAGEGSPLQAEACTTCRRYLKTVDERKLVEGTEVNLAAREMVTLHLDLAMEEEGFRN